MLLEYEALMNESSSEEEDAIFEMKKPNIKSKEIVELDGMECSQLLQNGVQILLVQC